MVTAIDNNTALVLIDLQKGIVKFPVAHPIDDVLENSAKLVAAFRKANMPIVIVNVRPKAPANGPTRKDAAQQGGTLPEEFFEIVPEIETKDSDIFITKETWNAFFNTRLQEELKQKGITGIVIAGVATSIGVEGTARSAMEFGYNIAFASDAMTDMQIDAHTNSISRIFPRMGEVDTTENIIAKLPAYG